MSAFNNSDVNINGEKAFFKYISNSISSIFDVGCRTDSEFTQFHGEVHYFDANPRFIQDLSIQPNKNIKSVFNSVGLGSESKELYYYPRYQSFINRIVSCHISDEANKVIFKIITGKEYMVTHDISSVDFLKIDTEGYEFEVMKGFEEYLSRVKIIQFEYGGTYIDTQVELVEVINYLKSHGFSKFAYIMPDGSLKLLTDFSDHYNYCNIVCIHNTSDIIPY